MTPEKYKELSIKEFTQAAKVYDSGHAGIYEMCKDDYPSILAELEKEKFHDVLDCGCGTGPMIQLLHDKYPEKHYVGLDLTPEMTRNFPIRNLLWAIVRIFLLQNLLLTQLSALTVSIIIQIRRHFSIVHTVF